MFLGFNVRGPDTTS